MRIIQIAFFSMLLNTAACAHVNTNLNGKGYTTVPLELIPVNTTRLYLQKNPFVFIPGNTFIDSGLVDLFEVRFSDCGFDDTSLSRDSFGGLENVKMVSYFKRWNFHCTGNQKVFFNFSKDLNVTHHGVPCAVRAVCHHILPIQNTCS